MRLGDHDTSLLLCGQLPARGPRSRSCCDHEGGEGCRSRIVAYATSPPCVGRGIGRPYSARHNSTAAPRAIRKPTSGIVEYFAPARRDRADEVAAPATERRWRCIDRDVLTNGATGHFTGDGHNATAFDYRSNRCAGVRWVRLARRLTTAPCRTRIHRRARRPTAAARECRASTHSRHHRCALIVCAPDPIPPIATSMIVGSIIHPRDAGSQAHPPGLRAANLRFYGRRAICRWRKAFSEILRLGAGRR